MAGPGLPVNVDASYTDDASDASVKTHQQHHDIIHTTINAIDTELPPAAVLLAGVVANNQTGTTYTLVLSDAGKVIEMNNASANTLRIPTNASVAFPIGTCIEIWQQGAGQTAVAAVTPGTTAIRSPGGNTHIAVQYGSAGLRKRAADEWCLEGNLA